MSIEVLDYVNEQDKVMGQAFRNVVHQQQLMHRASHLLIYNQDSIFLQLRHASKAQFPNCWDTSVGGHVNAGESYCKCIIRETQEELGIVCNNSLVQIAYYPASIDNGWEFSCLYKMYHVGPFRLNAQEISDGQWFAVPSLGFILQSYPTLFARQLSLFLQAYLLSVQ